MTENDIRQLIDNACTASTQGAVARKLGVTSTYVAQLRNGEREISRQIAAKLGYRLERVKTITKTFVEDASLRSVEL